MTCGQSRADKIEVKWRSAQGRKIVALKGTPAVRNGVRKIFLVGQPFQTVDLKNDSLERLSNLMETTDEITGWKPVPRGPCMSEGEQRDRKLVGIKRPPLAHFGPRLNEFVPGFH